MLHPSTQKLIDRLAEMTELGRIGWSKSDDNSVAYTTEGYSVAVTDAPHEFVIYSKDGAELERASAGDLTSAANEAGGTYGDVISGMFRQAKRIASGTEAAISTLLAGIEAEDATEPGTPEVEEVPEVTVDETNPEVLEAEPVSETPEPVTIMDEVAETPLTEPDVTDAVARMAKEVNERETQTETGAEAGLAGLASGLAVSALVSEDDVSTPDVPETDSVETEASTPDFVYQPFGTELETPALPVAPQIIAAADEFPTIASSESGVGNGFEQSPAVTDDLAATPEASEPPLEQHSFVQAELEQPTVDDVPPSTDNSTDSIDTTLSDAEPTVSADVSEDPFGSIAQPEETTSEEAETIEPEAITSETEVHETGFTYETESVSEVSEHAPEELTPSDNVVMFTATSEPEADSAEDLEADSNENEVETIAPAGKSEPEVRSTETDTPEPTLSAYSLSGIGAGFGLGALSATTEASGMPSNTSPVDESISVPQEKIIIDATDDLPPVQPVEDETPVRTADPLPDLASLDAPEPETPSEDQETEEPTPNGDDPLKPRTRFNPWG